MSGTIRTAIGFIRQPENISYNFIIKVSCTDIDALEHLLTHLQKMGNTNTQIILATPLDRSLSLEGDV